MFITALAQLGFVLMAPQAQTHRFDARILSGSVIACGVTVSAGETVVIAPVFEAQAPLSGSYRLAVTSRSGSNTGVTTQANRFSGRSLAAGRITLGRADALSIAFDVFDADGMALCALDIAYPQDVATQGGTDGSAQEVDHA